MKNKNINTKIKELENNEIYIDKFNKGLVIYNNKQEYIIPDLMRKVTIKHGIEKTTFNQEELTQLFLKHKVYEKITSADYNRVLTECEFIKQNIPDTYASKHKTPFKEAKEYALNYYINNEYVPGVLENTLTILEYYPSIYNLPLKGFHYKYNYVAQILEDYNVNRFGNITKPLYNKIFAVLEHNTDTLILNKSGNKIINGVIYKNSINAPNLLMILWGRVYDNIMNDPKVQYGYKYNQEPDTYQVADFTGCLNQINELYGKDKVVCDFRINRGVGL